MRVEIKLQLQQGNQVSYYYLHRYNNRNNHKRERLLSRKEQYELRNMSNMSDEKEQNEMSIFRYLRLEISIRNCVPKEKNNIKMFELKI